MKLAKEVYDICDKHHPDCDVCPIKKECVPQHGWKVHVNRHEALLRYIKTINKKARGICLQPT